ncbi:MAG: CPBP family intramembrane metalloprotease [Clostridia bacterium]|nr:CPBP family intramembrane metalloprotease [Clostridia bacterium]
MTQGEFYRGWAFFVLYFLIFPFLIYIVRSILDEQWGFYLSDAVANALYYYVCTAIIFLLFWSFLKNSFFILLDHIRENIFGLGSGLAGAAILTVLITVVPLPVENPVTYAYPEQFAISPGATVAILVILWPIIEETLFRGLLFGGVRRHNRALAWILSVVLFILFKVWQFAIMPDQVDLRYLLVGIQYLPMALAFTWCYDIGGSIWSSILLHMILNGASLLLLL